MIRLPVVERLISERLVTMANCGCSVGNSGELIILNIPMTLNF
jgi:hypothetical protein